MAELGIKTQLCVSGTHDPCTVPGLKVVLRGLAGGQAPSPLQGKEDRVTEQDPSLSSDVEVLLLTLESAWKASSFHAKTMSPLPHGTKFIHLIVPFS